MSGSCADPPPTSAAWHCALTCFLPPTSQFSLLTGLGALALMIWLTATPHSRETEQKRLGMLVGFAFLTGRWAPGTPPQLSPVPCRTLSPEEGRVKGSQLPPYGSCDFLLSLQASTLAPCWKCASPSTPGSSVPTPQLRPPHPPQALLTLSPLS